MSLFLYLWTFCGLDRLPVIPPLNIFIQGNGTSRPTLSTGFDQIELVKMPFKRMLFLVGFIFLFLGCTHKISTSDLPYLNGYWEIKEVIFADGRTKNYKVNTTLDYIEIKDLLGFRKKVRPKLDGSYSTSDDAEFFTVSEEKDALWLNYKNNLSEWKEKLAFLSSNKFSVTNEDGITYTYKRFEPINVQK